MSGDAAPSSPPGSLGGASPTTQGEPKPPVPPRRTPPSTLLLPNPVAAVDKAPHSDSPTSSPKDLPLFGVEGPLSRPPRDAPTTHHHQHHPHHHHHYHNHHQQHHNNNHHHHQHYPMNNDDNYINTNIFGNNNSAYTTTTNNNSHNNKQRCEDSGSDSDTPPEVPPRSEASQHCSTTTTYSINGVAGGGFRGPVKPRIAGEYIYTKSEIPPPLAPRAPSSSARWSPMGGPGMVSSAGMTSVHNLMYRSLPPPPPSPGPTTPTHTHTHHHHPYHNARVSSPTHTPLHSPLPPPPSVPLPPTPTSPAPTTPTTQAPPVPVGPAPHAHTTSAATLPPTPTSRSSAHRRTPSSGSGESVGSPPMSASWAPSPLREEARTHTRCSLEDLRHSELKKKQVRLCVCGWVGDANL
ncbi:hypothetical protein GWK47_002240 [Chionoecetes opilio]|uniref:Uncharacterized protein n=1 Tax=Chionoecetes opilio TaxID=41210 RepID=A0A8J4XRG0_CHIOP|nr:hypothetical protein GWK47_002240 [Chionoecetes opilio]